MKKYLCDEKYGTTTADQIRINKDRDNRVRETSFAMFTRHGITLKRWQYSDGSGIVFVCSDAGETVGRKYATAGLCDAFLFAILQEAIDVTDPEEAEVRLNQTKVGDEAKNRGNLYMHPQIAINKE